MHDFLCAGHLDWGAEVESFEIFWRKISQIRQHISSNPASRSEGFDENMENPNRRGVNDYRIPRAWGITHLGSSEGNGGWKCGSRPWYGMDIFYNCPFWTSKSLRANGITRTAGTNDWCINSDNTSNSYHFVDIVIWSCETGTTIYINHTMFALIFLTGVHTNYLKVTNVFNICYY